MLIIPPDKIRSWVGKHFPDFKERRDGEELLICNPFDGDDKYKFNINPDKATCNDWRGNHWQGVNKDGNPNTCTFINFVKAYLGCGYRDAITSVTGASQRFYLPSRKEEPEEEVEEDHKISLPDGSLPLWEASNPTLTGMLYKWLGSRGVTIDDIKKQRLHYLGAEVVWPYYYYDSMVYWQSRSRLNKQFRFPPSSIGCGKGDFLYGFDDVNVGSHLVITEAIFDKLTLRYQSVASGGAALTSKQIDLIKKLNPKDGIVLAPDNDKAGIASIAANGRILLQKGYKKVYYSLPPELPYTVKGEYRTTKDWNEIGQYISGWDQVPAIMEKNVQMLTHSEIIRLQMMSLASSKI